MFLVILMAICTRPCAVLIILQVKLGVPQPVVRLNVARAVALEENVLMAKQPFLLAGEVLIARTVVSSLEQQDALLAAVFPNVFLFGQFQNYLKNLTFLNHDIYS